VREIVELASRQPGSLARVVPQPREAELLPGSPLDEGPRDPRERPPQRCPIARKLGEAGVERLDLVATGVVSRLRDDGRDYGGSPSGPKE